MEVGLPKDAELWGTYVDGKSVKPTRNEKGKILIPLNRSQSSEGGLASFDVELIYFQKATPFGWLGIKKSSFAIPDLMMSRVIWSIYLPFDYSFIRFGGTMEKEKIARGISPLLGIGKRAVDYSLLSGRYRAASGASSPKPGQKGEKDSELERKRKSLSILQNERTLRSEFGKNLPVDQEVMADQLSREMSFSGKLEEVGATGGLTSGVMPIRIHVPTIGQVYRFAKQIATDEPLIVETTYIKDTPFTIVKLIFLLILVCALYRKRTWFKRAWDAGSGWCKERLARYVTPLSLLIISGFLFVVSFFSLPLVFTTVLFVVLLGAVLYYVAHTLKARKEKSREKKGMEIQE
jgi:hypothetical protein